ncbi:MAG: hypothetical protein QM820_50340 [Minicystis sp.]
MSDDREKKDDPAAELKQGLTHLWRAARGVAAGVKKEVERTDFGKAVDDAGREFVRAAANVVDRIAVEVDQLTKAPSHDAGEAPPPPPAEAQERPEEKPDDDDEFDGVKPREKGPTPQDPGFRIAVDDETGKKKPE